MVKQLSKYYKESGRQLGKDGTLNVKNVLDRTHRASAFHPKIKGEKTNKQTITVHFQNVLFQVFFL